MTVFGFKIEKLALLMSYLKCHGIPIWKKEAFALGSSDSVFFHSSAHPKFHSFSTRTLYLEELPVGDVSVPVHVVDAEEELQLLLAVLVTDGELGQAVHKLCNEERVRDV